MFTACRAEDRVWGAFCGPGVRSATIQATADAPRFFRRRIPNRPQERQWRAFARGVIIAAEMPSDIRTVYVHFIGSSATVARYASMICGLPLAASAHARDIWTSTEADIRAKLAAMSGARPARPLVRPPARARRRSRQGAPHLSRPLVQPFSGRATGAVGRADGSDFRQSGAAPFSRARGREEGVRRAVECALGSSCGSALALDAGRGRQDHRRSASPRGGSGIVRPDRMAGCRDQQAVIDLYRAFDLFVLPCREASDGDRDGLPNVLMEAQSQALACLSTNSPNSGTDRRRRDWHTGPAGRSFRSRMRSSG